MGLPEGVFRTLPERYMSFGVCTAYIGFLDLPATDGEAERHVRIVKWTCGLTVSMDAAVKLPEVRKFFKEMHDAHQPPPVPAVGNPAGSDPQEDSGRLRRGADRAEGDESGVPDGDLREPDPPDPAV